MNPIGMTKFRKWIGEKGAEKIFRLSLLVNAEEITQKEMKSVMIDSPVQEKNITFPTDAKLYRKIINKVLNMASKEGIDLRRTSTRELKSLKLKVRFMNHPTRMKEGKKAVRRIRTIARALVGYISRKMNVYQQSFYGKEYKKYEFGNKSAIGKTGSGLIVSALAFQGNPYDVCPPGTNQPPDWLYAGRGRD